MRRWSCMYFTWSLEGKEREKKKKTIMIYGGFDWVLLWNRSTCECGKKILYMWVQWAWTRQWRTNNQFYQCHCRICLSLMHVCYFSLVFQRILKCCALVVAVRYFLRNSYLCRSFIFGKQFIVKLVRVGNSILVHFTGVWTNKHSFPVIPIFK